MLRAHTDKKRPEISNIQTRFQRCSPRSPEKNGRR